MIFSQVLGKGSTRTLYHSFSCLHVYDTKVKKRNLLIFLLLTWLKERALRKPKRKPTVSNTTECRGMVSTLLAPFPIFIPTNAPAHPPTPLTSPTPKPPPKPPLAYPPSLNPSAQLATPPAFNSRYYVCKLESVLCSGSTEVGLAMLSKAAAACQCCCCWALMILWRATATPDPGLRSEIVAISSRIVR